MNFTEDVLAPPPVVWSLLTENERLPQWSDVRSLRVEQPGGGPTGRVGEVRAVKFWVGTVRERITTFEPEQRLSYELVSGAPVRDYHGTITLEHHGAGTRITWTVEFTANRYLDPVLRAVVKRVLGRTIRDLTTEANRNPTPSAWRRAAPEEGS